MSRDAVGSDRAVYLHSGTHTEIHVQVTGSTQTNHIGGTAGHNTGAETL